MAEHMLDVEHLQTIFHTRDGIVRAVDDVSFHVDAGEIIGVVGESGSGKSVTMMSVLQLIPMPPGEILNGSAIFEGKDILKYGAHSKDIRKVRGGGIAIIFQEPMTSLNPVMTVGQQIEESVMLHLGYTKAQARIRAIELLGLVGIPDGESRVDYYPSQFSGGMRQRVMIAMAISCNPKLLIADEATTALDVTTQEQILELLRDIVHKTHTALIIITHNLSIIARYANRIYVMYAGNIVEEGTCMEIFHQASHPYTMGLLRAIPRLDGRKDMRLLSIPGVPLNPAQKTGSCPFAPRCPFAKPVCHEPNMPTKLDYSSSHRVACWFRREEFPLEHLTGNSKASMRTVSDKPLLEVRGLKKYFPVTQGITRRKVGDVKALDDVSFTIYQGETLGLVGESGCGKTTLAKTLLRLYDATEGQIAFKGSDIAKLKEHQLGNVRRKVQFIFQDPYGSLDPRQTAGSVVGEAIRVHHLTHSRAEYEKKVDELFGAVGLDLLLKDRAPHEFSGGQRQRLCIAGALASDPSFVICDEPISALDVSIQSQIINLLIDLQAQRGLTYLFIAHDLSVVRHVSDRIIVMYLGRIVEISPAQELYEKPLHPYTQALLSAIPIPDPEKEAARQHIQITGEVPSLINRPTGCVFHPRCPYATDRCRNEVPPMVDHGNKHQVACFQNSTP